MRTIRLAVACLAVLVAAAGQVQAAVVFNNGAPDQNNASDMTAWVQAEDFVLAEDTSVTDLHFWTIESGTNWDGTLDYYLFNDNGANPAVAPFASGAGQNVKKTATGNTAFGLNEYSYWVDLENPVLLTGGVTYWIGLHLSNNFDFDGIAWETTSGQFGTNGNGSYGGTFDNWTTGRQEHAFYLTGEAPAVPEPSTFTLLSIGGLALVGYGWRRKRQQGA
ncbi:PEP-CTERM sorting domain-containing protein [Symmachiella dynata]|uniref:PEP-CTERM sorting domain-containing protein n=1 Tax=Symmachiella dynata TaxID=2527995 RepID=UPI0030EE393D